MSTDPTALSKAKACHEAGNFQEAESRYRDIVRADANRIDVWRCLAHLLYQTGRLHLAVECFREAATRRPDLADVHLDLAAILVEQGNFQEAITSGRNAVRLKSEYPEAHDVLGNALRANGRLEEAAASFREAIRLRHDFARAHYNLGSVLQQLGDIHGAAAGYRQAIRLAPNVAAAHNNLGNLLADSGKREEALECYRAAIRLNRDFVEAHLNLGHALQDSGRFEEAAGCFREAIRIRPGAADGYFHLAVALHSQGLAEQAASAYRETIQRQPDHAAAHNSLGVALQDLGQIAEAAACHRESIRLMPDSAAAHYNLSWTYLLEGDLERGWLEYEWRFRCTSLPTSRLATSKPLWDGSPLGGRTIYLYPEQGLGDALQFMRYAQLVKQRGGVVVVGAYEPLYRLAASAPGIDKLVIWGTEPPPFDVHAPMMSLPRIFGTALSTIPASVPYLTADPKIVRAWKARFDSMPGFRIAICWQGKPSHQNDRWRSARLKQFESLSRDKSVSLISVQKGPGREQLRSLPGLALDLDAQLTDLADTAGVLSNVDLVITVDTAVAHLAGALGRPVWTLLPYNSDWRWLLHREDSPWYPTMRLFRQKKLGDWNDVFERVESALNRVLKERS